MRRISVIAVALAAAGTLFSCASGPVVVPEGTTAAEIIQRAQEAGEANDFARAEAHYRIVLERFPDDQPSACAAEYEIAFIKYKQKKNEEAKTMFRALLARYAQPDAELLPAQYKVLGEKLLAKLELEGK